MAAVVTALVAAFAVVAGAAADTLDVTDRLGDSSPAPISTPSPPVSAPTFAQNASTAPPSSTAPDDPTSEAAEACVRDGQGLDPVDCQEDHQFEVMTGPCTLTGLIEFMGGVPGVDVPLPTLKSGDSGATCVIDYHRTATTSVRSALELGQDDGWRQCAKPNLGRMPCGEAHTIELVATGEQGKASQLECEDAAQAYMDQTVDAVADTLRVKALARVSAEENGPRCAIEVLGSQPLVASVRNLRVSSVPLQR